MQKTSTNKKHSITAIIIAKDEEKVIAGAIKTLDFVDEVLVVDTGSQDKTMRISKEAGATVVSDTKGKSFPDWRNFGLAQAHSEWVLYIDADERVPSALATEIKSIVSAEKGEYSAYAIPRSNFIFKREFRHGGWWPDYVKRLYKRSSLKKWEGDLHEEPIFEGELGHMTNHLIHQKQETIFEMVEKTNRWSVIEGQLMFDAHHPPMNVLRFCTGMWREFWYRMIVNQAFLDGKEGIIMAIYQVFSRFCSYAKLWELQIAQKKNK